jgi:peptidoglycan hydrolase CwlO-like protein
MSIQLIAKELYHFQKEVEKIEKQIEDASYEKREEMKDQLRKTKAERDRIRRMLNGCLEK